MIHVRGGRDVTLDVLRTDHGPVITPLLPHEKRTLALRWTAYDPAAVTTPFYQLDSAQNWEQFRAALANLGGPPENVVYADTQGNIGYQAAGKIPMRPHGLTGVPITDANHEWQGYIPFDQLPSVYNPPGGILATANSRVTPDGYAYPVTLDWGPPYRNERIWKVLASKPKLSAADMLALQNDVYSTLDQELAQRFTYAIDHAAHPSHRLREAADLMRTWDGNVTIPSVAATIVDATRDALWPMILKPRLGDEWKLYRWASSSFVQEQIVTGQSRRWLPKQYSNWNEFLAAAVDQWNDRPACAAGSEALALWEGASGGGGTSAVWRHSVDARMDRHGSAAAVGRWNDGEAGVAQLWTFGAADGRPVRSRQIHVESCHWAIRRSAEPELYGPVAVLVCGQNICAAIQRRRCSCGCDAHIDAGSIVEFRRRPARVGRRGLLSERNLR